MRELKFRAYAVNKKRFLNEDELHKTMPFFSGYELLGQDPHTFVLMDDTCDPGDDGVEKVTEIKWLQFTGLRDKNKRGIYEGDIVLFEGERREIVYAECGFFMAAKGKISLWLALALNKCEVIGNVYETVTP